MGSQCYYQQWVGVPFTAVFIGGDHRKKLVVNRLQRAVESTAHRDDLIRKLRKILHILHFHNPDLVNLVQIRTGLLAKLAAKAAISAMANPFCGDSGGTDGRKRGNAGGRVLLPKSPKSIIHHSPKGGFAQTQRKSEKMSFCRNCRSYGGDFPSHVVGGGDGGADKWRRRWRRGRLLRCAEPLSPTLPPQAMEGRKTAPLDMINDMERDRVTIWKTIL